MDIKLRMALWYASLALTTALLVGALLVHGSRRILNEYYEETLAFAAETAAQELRETGIWEVESAQLRGVPDVHTTLYTQRGSLIYGRKHVSLPFEQGVMQTQMVGDEKWYVLDTQLEDEKGQKIWLRCAKRADVEGAAYGPVLQLGAVMLAAMVILTAAGGYSIARRAMRPVQQMADTAREIVSVGDLHRRVGLSGGSNDELTALAHTLDGMLERLDGAFARERQFISDAAHELRTPLSGMRLLCDAAQASAQDTRTQELLSELSGRVDGLSELTGQLLSLSRLEAGRGVQIVECDLSGVMRAVVEELSPVAAEAEIALESDIEPGIAMRCDPGLMTRLAVNLLSNSIRYGRSGGFARLSLERAQDGAQLSVSDNGIGIAEEDLPHIFERFWRADSARTAGQGTGLGLSICKSIVLSHGGEISAQSEIGKGTRIIVKLKAQ